MWVYEGKYVLKDPENIFYKIIEENCPNLKNRKPIKVQEAYKSPNRLEQNWKSSCIILIKHKDTEQKILKSVNNNI